MHDARFNRSLGRSSGIALILAEFTYPFRFLGREFAGRDFRLKVILKRVL